MIDSVNKIIHDTLRDTIVQTIRHTDTVTQYVINKAESGFLDWASKSLTNTIIGGGISAVVAFLTVKWTWRKSLDLHKLKSNENKIAETAKKKLDNAEWFYIELLSQARKMQFINCGAVEIHEFLNLLNQGKAKRVISTDVYKEIQLRMPKLDPANPIKFYANEYREVALVSVAIIQEAFTKDESLHEIEFSISSYPIFERTSDSN